MAFTRLSDLKDLQQVLLLGMDLHPMLMVDRVVVTTPRERTNTNLDIKKARKRMPLADVSTKLDWPLED